MVCVADGLSHRAFETLEVLNQKSLDLVLVFCRMAPNIQMHIKLCLTMAQWKRRAELRLTVITNTNKQTEVLLNAVPFTVNQCVQCGFVNWHSYTCVCLFVCRRWMNLGTRKQVDYFGQQSVRWGEGQKLQKCCWWQTGHPDHTQLQAAALTPAGRIRTLQESSQIYL